EGPREGLHGPLARGHGRPDVSTREVRDRAWRDPHGGRDPPPGQPGDARRRPAGRGAGAVAAAHADGAGAGDDVVVRRGRAVIRVGVVGATGKMGRAVCAAVAEAPDLDLVAGVSRSAAGRTVGDALGIDGSDVVLADALVSLVDARAEVLVDFTSAAFAPEHV